MITIKIKHTKRIDYEGVTKVIFEKMEKAAKEMIEGKLSGLQCNEHGTTPEVEMDLREDNKYHFKILAACCPAFVEQIEQRLNA